MHLYALITAHHRNGACDNPLIKTHGLFTDYQTAKQEFDYLKCWVEDEYLSRGEKPTRKFSGHQITITNNKTESFTICTMHTVTGRFEMQLQ